jgi:ketosteroid isomerase-like protein
MPADMPTRIPAQTVRRQYLASATGKDMTARVAHSFIVRGGQIVRMEQIVDSVAVLAAMS